MVNIVLNSVGACIESIVCLSLLPETALSTLDRFGPARNCRFITMVGAVHNCSKAHYDGLDR